MFPVNVSISTPFLLFQKAQIIGSHWSNFPTDRWTLKFKQLKDRKILFPVDNNFTFAFPHLTNVPMKAILLLEVRSPLVAAGWGAVDLEQGAVSPVRLDSSIERSTAFENKPGKNVMNSCKQLEALLLLASVRGLRVLPSQHTTGLGARREALLPEKLPAVLRGCRLFPNKGTLFSVKAVKGPYLKQPEVRRDSVSNRQADGVAGDQVSREGVLHPTFAHTAGNHGRSSENAFAATAPRGAFIPTATTHRHATACRKRCSQLWFLEVTGNTIQRVQRGNNVEPVFRLVKHSLKREKAKHVLCQH